MLELLGGDRERGHEHDDVSQRPQEDAAAPRLHDHLVAGTRGGCVREQLHAAHQSPAADLVDARQRRDVLVEQRAELLAALSHTLQHVFLLEDVEGGDCRRTSQGVAGVGVTVEERLEFVDAAEETVVDGLGGERRRKRKVPAADALAEAENVWGDALLLAGKHRAGPAEAGGDLVADQEGPGLIAGPPQGAQIAIGLHEQAASALDDRLHDHGGQLRGVLGDDRCGGLGVAEGQLDGVEEQRPKALVEHVDSADGDGAKGVAVVTGLEVREAGARRLTSLHVALEGHLQRDLSRGGAGVGVEHSREVAGGDRHEALGEFDGRRVGQPEHRGVGDFAELRGDRGVDRRVAVAMHVAPQRRGAIEEPAAVGVDELAALAGHNDGGILGHPRLLLSERVPQDRVVAVAQCGANGGWHTPNRTVGAAWGGARMLQPIDRIPRGTAFPWRMERDPGGTCVRRVLVVFRLRAPSLGFVVAASGMSTLGAEIATARLLAPAFGSSTIIWANTIAIVLVALAIGAWLGGRLADRGPSPHKMYLLLLGGSGLLALTPILAVPLLSAGVQALDDISAPGFFGSLVAVLLLVATPLALLGAVSPYAVRLALGAVERGGDDAVARAGGIAGRLSALATGGSLVGTFISALALIPLVGTRRTFLLFSLVLAVVAVWGLATAQDDAPGPADNDARAGAGTADSARRPILLASLVPLAIVVMLVAPAPTVKAASGGLRLLEERETNEQYARVLESPDGMRTMELGEGHAIHSLWRPGTVLTGAYWDELLILGHLSGRAPKKVLILGNAGGTIATSLRALDPDVHVDAVDYDAQLAELGKKWFGLGGPRLRLLTGDARVELRRSDGGYDAIIVDAYRQPYIPFHLSTKEFFELTKDRLAPGGVVVVNVGHPEGDQELEQVLGATMRAAGLTSVLRDPAQTMNTQLVARAEPIDVAGALRSYQARRRALAQRPGAAAESAQLTADRAQLDQAALDTAARLEPARSGGTVYTDDKAPVELLIDGSLAKVAVGGGE